MRDPLLDAIDQRIAELEARRRDLADIDIGFRPHRFQQEIYDRRKRFSVIVAHQRFGKTLGAIALLIAAAVHCRLPSPRFGYVAPYLKQARQVAWDYMKQFAGRIPGVEIREGDLAINLPNAARITLYGADNPEAMRGLYFDGVVCDEMADFRPDVWPAIIRPTLSDRQGWAFFIGTPKGENAFAELYRNCDKPENRAEWIAMMFRGDETGLVKPEEMESNRRTMSPALYRQEMLCDFSAASDNVLITIDVISAAAQKRFNPYEVDGMPKIIGVDIARFGDDRSVIQRRQGLCALEPIVMCGLDNMEVVGRLSAQINEWQPDQVFIDAGRGEGVIDRLRQLGYSVMEVNFGGKASDPNAYVNKRSEMWDEMAKWFAAGGGIPNDPELKRDLVTPTYKFDAANRFQLESKDDMRKRIERSPDLGDALALTFALKIGNTRRRNPYRDPYRAAQEWDPFREPDNPDPYERYRSSCVTLMMVVRSEGGERMRERFKVATIEVWPNSGGQGGYISVYAAAREEYGTPAVWLRGDFDGPGALCPSTAEKLAEAIKRAAGIARGEIKRGDLERLTPTMWEIIEKVPLFGAIGKGQSADAKILERRGFISVRWDARPISTVDGRALPPLGFPAVLTDAGIEAFETRWGPEGRKPLQH
jgi:hypothetical protein